MSDEQHTLEQLLDQPGAEESGVMALSQRGYEEIVLRFLGHLVAVDGVVSMAEIGKLVDLAGVFEVPLAEAQRIVEEECGSSTDVALLAAQIHEPRRRREAFALGCLVATLDGHVHERERAVLAEFALGAGLSESEAREILEDTVQRAR